MEKKLAQKSTITTNEFKTSFPIFINKSSNTSISNFVTSHLRESLSASESDACVYSTQNKSKNRLNFNYFKLLNCRFSRTSLFSH